MAKDVIDTPFAVINADDFYGKESFVAMYEFLTTAATQDVYSLDWISIEKYNISIWICKSWHLSSKKW